MLPSPQCRFIFGSNETKEVMATEIHGALAMEGLLQEEKVDQPVRTLTHKLIGTPSSVFCDIVPSTNIHQLTTSDLLVITQL